MEISLTIEQLNKLQEKISILERYDINVDTINGFKRVKAVGITSPLSEKIKVKTNNFELIGSPSHRVKKNGNWIHLKELLLGENILTKNGYEQVINIQYDSNKEDLWDIEVEGEEYYSNGIVSHNSTIMSALDFVLFGKCKGTNLSDIPNRINLSDTLVNIKFNSGSTDIEIERGISPNKLKLIENKIENDQAGKSNINNRIEKYIGFDMDSFKSFVNMSINDFKNFISLSNEEKKMLLDKLFNLEVINILNDILKEVNKANKLSLNKYETEINVLQDSINSISLSIEKSLNKEKNDINAEISNIKMEMESKKEDYSSLKDKIEKINLKDKEIKNEIEKEREQYINIQNEIKVVQTQINLFDKKKCPTCETNFDTEHFLSLKDILEKKKNGLDKLKSEIDTNLSLLKVKQDKLKIMSDSASKLYNDLVFLLKSYKSQIEKLQSKVISDTFSSSVQEFENSIKELNAKKELNIEKVSIFKEKEISYKELSKILGEDGVKKSIISSMISPINHYINENINCINFPFKIELDETFNAEITHLGMPINHSTLSSGEKKLANIILMLSYLQLIKTKVFLNILFLDEVFSTVDLDNIEKILQLLKEFCKKFNMNIFVVHHCVMNGEYFDRIIEISKSVFSEIVEI